MARRQLRDEWLGQPRERVVHRVAHVAMVDAAAVGRRNELDDLAGPERPIDDIERGAARDTMLGDRLGDLAERLADGTNPDEVTLRSGWLVRDLRSRSIGALSMDDAPTDEPVEGVIQVREVLSNETIVVVEGVQGVKGGVEIDPMGMARIRATCRECQHLDNHSIPVDRLRASR